MTKQPEEEAEKYNLLQKEIFREKDFLKKIEDLFELVNSKKFQDIIILQRNKYIEQVVKEILLMLKMTTSKILQEIKNSIPYFSWAKKNSKKNTTILIAKYRKNGTFFTT